MTAARSDPAGARSSIRRGRPEDAGELFTVQRAAFVTEGQEHDTPFLPPLVETLEEVAAALADAGTLILVAELTGERGIRLAGSARRTIRDGRAWIGRVSVAPDLAGRGIGSALLQQLHDAPGPAVSGFSLWAGGRSTGNHTWYAGHGYLITGSTVDELGVPVVMMARPVLRAAPDPAATVVVCVTSAPTGPPTAGQAAGRFPTEVARGTMLPGESLRTAAARLVGGVARFIRPTGYHRVSGEGTAVLACVLVGP